MIILGVGTGSADTLTIQGLNILKSGKKVFLQTERAPLAEYLRSEGVEFQSLDVLYDEAEDFDELAEAAAQKVSAEDGILAVYGSVWQNALAQACTKLDSGAEIIPGVSFAEYSLSKAGVSEGGARVFSAGSEVSFDTDYPLVITDVGDADIADELIIKLLGEYPADFPACVISSSGAMNTTVHGLYKYSGWDFTCSIVLDKIDLLKKERFSLSDLAAVLRRLRAPGGCPWDREQTHESLMPYLLEESYEVLDAVQKEDMFALADELGDVLLQVVFHSVIAEAHEEFMLSDVTTSICQKMIRRHTHIFVEDKCETSDEVLKNWERVKREQSGASSVTQTLEEVPETLTALMRAAKIQKKAASVGFDWDGAEGAIDKVLEETEEVRAAAAQNEGEARVREECGDMLFACVNVLRHLGVSGEVALSQACDKFTRRFAAMESTAKHRGKELADMTLEEMDAVWDEIKHG